MELASVATANRSDQLSPFGVLLGQTPFTTKETARSQADRVDPGPDCDDATEERATSLPLAGSEKGKRLEPTISSSSISRTSVSSFFRTSKAPGIDKWNNKGSEVSDIIYARHGYERLQDLCSDQIKYICPDQLKHLKTLGVGTFAGDDQSHMRGGSRRGASLCIVPPVHFPSTGYFFLLFFFFLYIEREGEGNRQTGNCLGH